MLTFIFLHLLARVFKGVTDAIPTETFGIVFTIMHNGNKFSLCLVRGHTVIGHTTLEMADEEIGVLTIPMSYECLCRKVVKLLNVYASCAPPSTLKLHLV